MKAVSPVEGLFKYWNAVRPAWPAVLAGLVQFLLFGFTSQMIEVFRLEALSLLGYDLAAILRLTPSWAALVLCASVLHFAALYAVFGTYDFTARATRLAWPRIWAARLAGGITPFGLLAVSFMDDMAASFEASAWIASGGLLTACLAWVVITRGVEAWMLSKGEDRRWRLRRKTAPAAALAVAAALACAALAAGLRPYETAVFLGPIGTGSLGFAVWGFVGVAAVMAAAKTRFLPVWLTALFVVGLFGLFNDNHAVRLGPRPAAHAITAGAHEHLGAWLAARLEADREARRVRPVVVIAEGGGARAAYFTASVLAELHETSEGRLTRDLAVLSGVSGGAVGIASFLAAAADQDRVDCRAPDAVGRVQAHLGADHLSPGMAGLLFRDAPQRLIPWPVFPDRAATFEQSLERAWPCGDGRSSPLALPLEAVLDQGWSRRGLATPLVLFGVVRTDSGALEVVSNAALRSPKNALARVRGAPPLSASAYLSSRFPLISPAGRLTTRDGETLRYVDGGYSDMTGAAAAREAVYALSDLTEAAARSAQAGCTTQAFDHLPIPARLKRALALAMLDAQGRCRTDLSVEPVVLNLASRLTPEPAPAAPAAVAAPVETGAVRPLPSPSKGDPFGDLTTPFATLIAARHHRRGDGLENLCHAAAPSLRACAALHAERLRAPAPTAEAELQARTAAFRRMRWVNATLDHRGRPHLRSAFLEPHAHDHVPLGWHLGAMDIYVADKAKAEAALARAVLESD